MNQHKQYIVWDDLNVFFNLLKKTCFFREKQISDTDLRPKIFFNLIIQTKKQHNFNTDVFNTGTLNGRFFSKFDNITYIFICSNPLFPGKEKSVLFKKKK